MRDLEIIVRPYQHPEDDPYIYSTWTRYAWYSPKNPIKEHKKEWFEKKIKYIKDILETKSVKIACLKNTPFMIMGYIVVHDRKIEWICVKKDYQKQGIEELLKNAVKEEIDE